MRLFHRAADGFTVNGLERAQINDLGADAILLQALRGLEAQVHAEVVADEGDVGAAAHDLRAFQRAEELVVGDGFLHVVHALVFDHDHRIVAAHRRLQHAAGIERPARGDHAQARGGHEHARQPRRMLRRQLVRRAARGAHHERTGHAAAGHVADLGAGVDERIQRQ